MTSYPSLQTDRIIIWWNYFLKANQSAPLKKICRDILLNLGETKTHINDDDCQGMCSNTAIVTNLTERFVINPGCFYCAERERQKKILVKYFSIYLIKKMDAQQQIVKTLVEGATDLLEMQNIVHLQFLPSLKIKVRREFNIYLQKAVAEDGCF